MRLRVALVALMPVILLAGTRIARAEDLVDNPQYASWAKLKPGSSITLTTDTAAMGQQVKTEMVQKLSELTPDQAVIEVVMSVEAMGTKQARPPQKVSIKAKVPKDQADRTRLPEGMKGESKELPDETVDAMGKSYTCKVTEFSGVISGMNAKGKIWRNDDVPGQVVKSQVTTEGAMASTSTTTLSAMDVK